MMRGIKEKYKAIPIGAKATIWYTFANLMQKAINVLVVPLYTRMLTTSEYGTYSVFISWMELFEIIVTFRLFYGAYVVGLVKFEEDRECYTSSLEKLSVLVTTLFLGIYLVFQVPINAMTELTTPLTLLMFGMMYAIPIVGFWKAWQRVDNKYLEMVVVSMILAIVTPIMGVIGVVFARGGALAVIGSRVGVETIIAIVLFILYKNRFTRKINIDYWKYALKMNIPLIPYYLSMVALNHSDRIIIQKLVGYSEAGIYSVAYSAAMVMTMFTSAFNSSLQPWLFKELKSKKYADISPIMVSTLLLIAILNLGLIAVAPEVISILAPSQYHEAIWIIPPLAASVLVMAFYQNYVNIEFYYNESKITAVASIGAALLNIALNFWLIPIMGYLIAGYTTLISYLVFLVTHYFFAKKVCKRNECPFDIFESKKMLLILLVFFVLSAIMIVGYIYEFIRYGLLMAICVVILVKKKDILFMLKALLKEKKEIK